MLWQELADSRWSGKMQLNPVGMVGWSRFPTVGKMELNLDGKEGFSRLPTVLAGGDESPLHGRIEPIPDRLG